MTQCPYAREGNEKKKKEKRKKKKQRVFFFWGPVFLFMPHRELTLALAAAEAEVWRMIKGAGEPLLSNSTGERPAPIYFPELEARIDKLGAVTEVAPPQGVLSSVDAFLGRVLESALIAAAEREVSEAVRVFDHEVQQALGEGEGPSKRITGAGRAGPGETEAERKRENTACIRSLQGDSLTPYLEASLTPCPSPRSLFSSSLGWHLHQVLLSQDPGVSFLSRTYAEKLLSGTYLSKDNPTKYYSSADSATLVNKCYPGIDLSLLTKYNGHFLFAELFLCLRGGLFPALVEHLDKYKEFLRERARGVYEGLCKIASASGNTTPVSAAELGQVLFSPSNTEPGGDPFREVLQGLLLGRVHGPRAAIRTLEDFLWYSLMLAPCGTAQPYASGVNSTGPGREGNAQGATLSHIVASVGPQKGALSAALFGDWVQALSLICSSFPVQEALILAPGALRKILSATPANTPSGTPANTLTEAVSRVVQVVQRASSLLPMPADRLRVLRLCKPFLGTQQMQEMAAEVIVAAPPGEEVSSALSAAVSALGVTQESVLLRAATHFLRVGDPVSAHLVAAPAQRPGIAVSALLQKLLSGDYLGLDAFSYLDSDSEGVSAENSSTLSNAGTSSPSNPETASTSAISAAHLGQFLLSVLRLGAAKEGSEEVLKRVKGTGVISPGGQAYFINAFNSLRGQIKGREAQRKVIYLVAKRARECSRREAKAAGKLLLSLASALDGTPREIQEIVRMITL